MSVRAYKLIEIKTKKTPTFNCWRDEKIMTIAQENEDNAILTIYKNRAIKLLKQTKDKNLIAILKKIIKDCRNQDYCDYYCY